LVFVQHTNIKMKTEFNFKVFISNTDPFRTVYISRHLKDLGVHDITRFKDQNDFLNYLNHKPDIIFVDYDVNSDEAFELIKKIKRTEPDTYVVIVTSRENIPSAVKAIRFGAFDYVVKGEEGNYLYYVIQRIICIRREIKVNNSRFADGSNSNVKFYYLN
jgi:DNA-binding NtrC family response regulator